jgi:hypothetical protein
MDSKQMKTIAQPVLDRGTDRLDSWKEIAAYLHREIRTVQRWERREALPVHRHVHAKASSVWAFKHQMDAWLHSRNRPPSEAAPKQEYLEPVSESLNPTLPAATRTPAKTLSWLQNATAGVGSLDLLQGENRIRLYFYVQLRAERDATAPLKAPANSRRGVN